MLAPFNPRAARVGHFHARAREGDHVAVLEVDHPAGVRDQRGEVRREEVLALAQAHHERAAHAGAGHEVGLLDRDHSQRVGPPQVGHGLLHGGEELAFPAQVVVDQVGDDLGVGLRLEFVTQRLQARALLLVVLDDAVVHHRDLALRDVRVRIGLGDAPVGRPTRMGDADDAVQALGAGGVFHLGNPPDPAHAADTAVDHRDPGRVVPAIFEALQPLGEHGNDVPVGNGPDDAAHGPHCLTRRRGLAQKKALPGLGTGESFEPGAMLLASRRPSPAGEEETRELLPSCLGGARGAAGNFAAFARNIRQPARGQFPFAARKRTGQGPRRGASRRGLPGEGRSPCEAR